jgi:hypothetical protein
VPGVRAGWRVSGPIPYPKVEEGAAKDAVNHPAHYNSHPSGVECITVVEHMGFNVGNAIKYLWRADLKGNALEDLKKAAWYVQREIERREAAIERSTVHLHVPMTREGGE